MIEGWLAGKLSGIIIFAVACTAPFLLVFWIWEAVELHGIEIPLPLFGHIELVHGAIADKVMAEQARDKANAARDKALADLVTSQGNEATLKAGLKTCNDSVADLKKKGEAQQAKAQAAVDAALKAQKGMQSRIAALESIKPTDEKCAVVDQIFTVGGGQ